MLSAVLIWDDLGITVYFQCFLLAMLATVLVLGE
jgi:hypothetical protein